MTAPRRAIQKCAFPMKKLFQGALKAQAANLVERPIE
jgi:hypothetical protein